MATRGWPAAVIHNGVHLFVISSRRGDSWKQRTGYGGMEQKAIRSTIVQPPRARCSRGLPSAFEGGRVPRCCYPFACSYGGGRKKERTGGKGAKRRELPVRKRASFRRHFYFVSAENSRLTLRERRCPFERKRKPERKEGRREKDRRSRFCVVSVTARRGPFRRANFYYLEMFHVISRVEKQERVLVRDWRRPVIFDGIFCGKLPHDVNAKGRFRRDGRVNNRYNGITNN